MNRKGAAVISGASVVHQGGETLEKNEALTPDPVP
jgi:hypothetical protein